VEDLDEVPAFASEEEEAQFWATHDPGDALLAQMAAPDDGLLPMSRPRSVFLSHDARQARYERLTRELRDQLSDDAGSVMIFLGAGLSFGVSRRLGRASFQTPPPLADEERFPSWPLLIDRMRRELDATAESDAERRLYETFFAEHEALDAAQLFRLEAGDERYAAFLQRQFATQPEDAERLTPSHEALVQLPVRELLTTNYDRLIELAFERWHTDLSVSVEPDEFLATRARHPARHLIKLHGSIERPASIVLTRDDYARSRLERVEMLRHLGQQARFDAFLFVGFSLTDPTFNTIRDEARAVMGDAMPTSYLVQQRTDPVTSRYLQALDVEVIELFSWNELPRFLRDINPTHVATHVP